MLASWLGLLWVADGLGAGSPRYYSRWKVSFGFFRIRHRVRPRMTPLLLIIL